MKKVPYPPAEAIVCPYYRRHNSHAVYCDGFIPDTEMRLGFSLPANRKEYMVCHCMTDGYAASGCMIVDCMLAALSGELPPAPTPNRDADERKERLSVRWT